VKDATAPYGKREIRVCDVSPFSCRKFTNIKGLYSLGDCTMRSLVLSFMLVKLKIENPSTNEEERATTAMIFGSVAHNDTAVVVLPNEQEQADGESKHGDSGTGRSYTVHCN
jgi:hypothetical protein